MSLTLKRQLICQGGRVFCQVRRLICQVGTFICQGGQNIIEKRRLIFSCVRGLNTFYWVEWGSNHQNLIQQDPIQAGAAGEPVMKVPEINQEKETSTKEKSV